MRKMNENVESPAPDPGNSAPEKWTEPMDASDMDRVVNRLMYETSINEGDDA